MSERIGFIGLGTMGGGMARNIAAAGFPLTVYDTNPDTLTSIAQQGARIATSPRAVADEAGIVLACLPSIAVSMAVALGSEGVAHGRAIHTYLECSTIGPDTVVNIGTDLAAYDIAVLDCPISGGKNGAQAGTLTAIVGGPDAVLARVRPVIEAFSSNIFHVAHAVGGAQTAKLINNMLSSAGMMAAFEGMVMGVKAGLEATALIEMINVSTGRNSATLDKFPTAILPRTFGGRITTGMKDLDLFIAEAERVGSPVWIATRVREIYAEAAAAGFDQESLRIIQYMEKLAGGIEVKGDFDGPRSSGKGHGAGR